ncbi:MAG: aromatic amino acid transport family protein, partial [Nanopusillaceae archaeon]
MDNKLVTLVYLILSTMIGAGILALPYALYSVGIFSSIFLYLISAFIIYVASTILLRASLKYYKTILPEVFGRYLGKGFKRISFFLISLSIVFVCIAYLNVINLSIKFFNINSEVYTLLITAIAMAITFVGFNLVEKSEKILFTIKIIIILFFLSYIVFIPKKYDLEFFSLNIKSYFQLLLISVFAFSFYSIVPSLLYVTRDEKLLRKSIIISISIALFLYFVFSYFTAFRSGSSEISTLSFSSLTNFLTLFLVITPYLILSWILSENISEFFRQEKRVSVLISFGLPFILF